MADANQFNEYFYEILAEMEEQARNCLEENDKNGLVFLDEMKDEIQKMNKAAVFEDSLIDYVSNLDAEEEEFLFYNVAVPFYEEASDLSFEEDEESGNLVENWARYTCATMIVEMLNDYSGYDYFNAGEEFEEEETEDEEVKD